MKRGKVVKRAFTLIELLVVIAIIGILSGLIIVSMNGITRKATISKSQIFSNSIKSALMMNLVSEWKFEGDVLDTWQGINGTIIGTPAYSSDCISGQCLVFSGDDCISIPSKTYNLGTGATFSFWSKKNLEHNGTVLGNSISEGYMRLIFLSGATLYLETNTNADYCSGSPTHDTNWHYYVITASGNIAKFYEDCRNITSNNNVINSNITFDRIGCGYYYNGSLDEIRMYDAVMPASKIQEQYYAGLNNLYSSGQITKEEYSNRIIRLAISSLD